MRKKKIKILHVAQAAGGVDRYIRMLLKYLDVACLLSRWEGFGLALPESPHSSLPSAGHGAAHGTRRSSTM